MVLMNLVRTLLSKLKREKSTALAVQRPDPALNGTFLRSVDGRMYFHRCICGEDHQLPATLAAALSVNTCGGCRQKYSLVRAIDAVNADDTLNVSTQMLEVRLNSLPVRAVERSAPSPRVVPISDYSIGETRWGGANDRARDAAIERCDPGFSGLF
jgi:hypothetical protein